MSSRRGIVFLDRDGVINRYPGDGNWVTNAAGFEFLPGAVAAIARLAGAGFALFVVSNQAGVDKGIFSAADLDEITVKMTRGVAAAGGRLERVLYCTHSRERGCACRKPRTGLLEQATSGLDFPRDLCYFIGDSATDIETGRNFGCRTILVFSGKEPPGGQADWAVRPDFTAADLAEAAGIVLAGLGRKK